MLLCKENDRELKYFIRQRYRYTSYVTRPYYLLEYGQKRKKRKELWKIYWAAQKY